MRIFSLTALLLLGACHGPSTTGANHGVAAADDGDRIACARGTAALSRTCTVDRHEGVHGLVLTVRNPDESFHRLLVTKDGRGVIAADGAQRAVVTIAAPDMIDVVIGGDRYRLPATVEAKPAAR